MRRMRKQDLLRLELNKITKRFWGRFGEAEETTKGEIVGVVATILEWENDKAFRLCESPEFLCFLEGGGDRLVDQHYSLYESRRDNV